MDLKMQIRLHHVGTQTRVQTCVQTCVNAGGGDDVEAEACFLALRAGSWLVD